MKKVIIFTLVSILALSIANASKLPLKERVKQRAPQITSLLAGGQIGLDNNGYLISRMEISDNDARIVADENSDRKVMHTAIAKKSGSPVAQVEKRSALKFIERLPKGAYYKDAKGEWVRK